VRRDLRVTGYCSPCTDLLMDAIVPAFLARPTERRKRRSLFCLSRLPIILGLPGCSPFS
jgi:hypothetical protein